MIISQYCMFVLGLSALTLSGCAEIGKSIDDAAAEIANTINSAGTSSNQQSTSPSNTRTKLTQYEKNLASDVQIALNAKGYHAGQADGKWGSLSRSAMRNFQRDNKLEQTGELDGASLDILGINSAHLFKITPKPGSISTQTRRSSENVTVQGNSTANKSSAGTGRVSQPDTQESVTETEDIFRVGNSFPEVEPTQDASVAKGNTHTTQRTTIAADLYIEPDPFSNVLLRVPKGTELDVLAESAEWLNVEYNEFTGFVEKNAVQ